MDPFVAVSSGTRSSSAFSSRICSDLSPDIQEIFGSHYELPELGPLGSNGLALPQDFDFPVASYDLDVSLWRGILPSLAHFSPRIANAI